MPHNVEYMASWGIERTNLSTCINFENSANVSSWNDTPNLLYTLLGCVYFNQNGTYRIIIIYYGLCFIIWLYF